MANYEHVFIARQDVSAQQVEGLVDSFKSVIEENGGQVGKVEQWGLRTMQYRIKKNRKGHYVLMNISAPHAAVAEMERQQKLNDDIIRVLTLRVDELDDEPSAMMKKEEKSDRRGPGRGRRDDRDDRDNRGDRGDNKSEKGDD